MPLPYVTTALKLKEPTLCTSTVAQNKKKKTGRYYRQHEKYFLFKYNFADKTEDEDEDHHLAAGHMPNKK